MRKKEAPPKRSTRKALVRGVVRAARTAKCKAKAVLMTGRTLTAPVELEPRSANSRLVKSLLDERARLVDQLDRHQLVEQERPTTGNHMADDATEVSEQAKALALRRHLEGMLKEMDRAIARAERGKYGVCEQCGGPISEERLKVMPSATLCISCAKLQIRPLKAAA